MKIQKQSFIVDFWASIFDGLRWFSTLSLIRSIFKSTRQSHFFVDAWILGNLIFAIFGTIVSIPGSVSFWQGLLLIYGTIRVFESMIDKINVFLFDEYRTNKAGLTYAVGGFRRTIILHLHSYVEVMFWYATFYLSFNSWFENGSDKLQNGLQAFYFSFYALTSFGLVDTSPANASGQFLVFSESAIGLFMAVILLARFVSLLPTPKTLDKTEKR